MPKSTTARESDTEIEVDPDQADTNKAVNRQSNDDDRPLTTEDGEDGRTTSWLQKSRAVNRRMASFERNLKKSFDQQRADDEARHQRELREIREQMNGLKVDREGEVSDSAHEAEMEALQGKLEAAIEAGDSKEQARLNALISRKEAAYVSAKTARLATSRVTEKKEPEPAKAAPKGSAKAQEFIQSTPWWDDPDHWEEKAYANALHARMLESGSDPESDEHYAKLTQKLHKKFPDLEVDESLLDDDDKDEAEEVETPRRRAPVRNFKDRGEERTNVRGGRIQLSKADIETMKGAKLDPTNNAHVVAFAKAKRERLESEGA